MWPKATEGPKTAKKRFLWPMAMLVTASHNESMLPRATLKICGLGPQTAKVSCEIRTHDLWLDGPCGVPLHYKVYCIIMLKYHVPAEI